MTMIHLPAAGYRRERWRNGGGWTRQLAAGSLATPVFGADAPTQHWDWRLSIAEVEADGPFSTFAGIDRTLVLLSGAGMDLLSPDGSVMNLASPLSRADFPGEQVIEGRLRDGATTDFNLMWRRDAVRASLRVLPLAEAVQGLSTAAWLTALHVLEGDLEIDARTIAPGDTMLLPAHPAKARIDLAAGARIGRAGVALLIGIDPASSVVAASEPG